MRAFQARHETNIVQLISELTCSTLLTVNFICSQAISTGSVGVQLIHQESRRESSPASFHQRRGDHFDDEFELAGVCSFFWFGWSPAISENRGVPGKMRPAGFFAVLFCLLSLSHAGPITSVACMSACNAGVVTCYSLAGLTFGTVTLASAAAGPVGWGAWLWSVPASMSTSAAVCSAAQGVCMAACAAAVVLPAP
jgi:hypothetical protein